MKYISLLLSSVILFVLAACSFTAPQLGKSIYWRGKPAEEFFMRYRYPDVSLNCVKDNKVRRIHGYKVAIYDLKDYEVGRDHSTIYMQREKVYTGSQWTVLFADENDTITSVGNLQWGNIEKQYGCGQYAEKHTRNTTEDFSSRPIKPRVWRAIAMDDASESTRAYESSLHTNEADAKAEAVRKCQRAGGTKCLPWQWFSNVCMGVATGNKQEGTRSYFGSSLRADHADQMAVKQCSKSATECKTFRPAACAVPCDILGDKKCMFDRPMFGTHGFNGNKTMPWFLSK